MTSYHHIYCEHVKANRPPHIYTSNVNENVPLHVAYMDGIKIWYLHRIYLPLLLKIPSVYNTMKRKETNQIEQKKGCETPNRIEMKGTEQNRKEKQRRTTNWKEKYIKIVIPFRSKTYTPHQYQQQHTAHSLLCVLVFMRVFFTMCCVAIAPTQQDAHLNECVCVCVCVFRK